MSCRSHRPWAVAVLQLTPVRHVPNMSFRKSVRLWYFRDASETQLLCKRTGQLPEETTFRLSARKRRRRFGLFHVVQSCSHGHTN